jgi:hypothetical protein
LRIEKEVLEDLALYNERLRANLLHPVLQLVSAEVGLKR